jgi:ATP synthase protein I
MTDRLPTRGNRPEERPALPREVEHRAQRKLRARRERDAGIWFSLGMFGLVGWSVAVPTLAATALGIWIDKTWPSRVSWTLTLLLLGIVVGCFNAWYWVRRESRRD